MGSARDCDRPDVRRPRRLLRSGVTHPTGEPSALSTVLRIGRLAGCGALALVIAVSGCSSDAAGPGADDFIDEPAPVPAPEIIAFVDVNVVGMNTDGVVRDQTVIVRRDRITEIGPKRQVEVPEGAFRIEGQGRYLMPGLADMHVHLTSDTFSELRNDFMLWLANGVTTIRVMWGGTGILAERNRIAAGQVLGPTLLVASPGVDGPGGTWTASTPPVNSAQEAMERVIAHAAAGYDFIKVYNDLTPSMYQAITQQAAQLGIRVVGHVPSRVGFETVLSANQLTLEHLIGIKLQASSPFTGGTLDMQRVGALAVLARQSNSWFTPTNEVNSLSASRASAIRSSTELATVSPGMRSFFEDGFHNGLPNDVAERERTNQTQIAGVLHQEGVGLLAGTDAGFGWMVPGYSIHDELQHFRNAGLSRYETLRTATANAAASVNQTGVFGAVVEGARADLVLVARNPLGDLATVRDPSGVMVRGVWLSRGVLRTTLDGIRQSYQAGSD